MRKPRLLLVAALSWSMALGGCSRPFFRTTADKDVTHLLIEKDQYPDWRIEQYHVYPDPRARFADQSDPDCPPMPPDDPAASKLSPHPQNPGKAGISAIEGKGYLEMLQVWDAQNRAEAEAAKDKADSSDAKEPEKPDEPKTGTDSISAWTETSLMGKPKPDACRPFLLKLEQAVELGLINSREYQDARENLYLIALPVTQERFAFQPQFFAVAQAIREHLGSQVTGGPRNDWTVNSNAGVTQLFSTGALLLFNFANQTVINLTGAARGVVSQSTIDLDLVQPFLRGGGLAVTLEPLTQVERNLVYAIRDFARFRKEFYVAIAGGGGGSITGANFQPQNVIASPTFRAGQTLGNSGLFPGIVATATAPLGVTGTRPLQLAPGESGLLGLQTALVAPVSGYLSTLLEAAQIRVDTFNIQKLDGFLKLAKGMMEGGDLSQLQVDQFEQALLRGRTALLNDQQDYLQTIDQLKLQLGLPPDLLIELDDTPFRPLNQQFQKYENLFNQYKATSDEPLRFGSPDMVAQVRDELRRIFTTSALVRGTPFRATIEARWGAWAKLSDDDLGKRLAQLREERRKLLDRKTDLETKNQALSATDQARLDTVEFEIDLGEFEKALRVYESQPWKKLPDADAQRRNQQGRFSEVLQGFIIVLTQARNERMKQLHDEWPKLNRVCATGVDLLKGDLTDAEETAVQYAITHRLDLMNVRGQVVDAWRQIAVFANALLGTFNVQYHMDSFTPALMAKPLTFGGSRTRQQLLLNTELPLVRIQERNNYRASLINYQRSRRILQRAEDEVQYDVRQELILLRQQADQYQIQARQVELGYMTVENALDTFAAPPGATPAGQSTTDTATRAAALTTQLINAQTSLYNAQFALTSLWITYLNTRQQLYRDMEMMNLDDRGVWIDNVETCECPPATAGDAKTGGESERLPEPRPVGGSTP
jgi:hypothetical protein